MTYETLETRNLSAGFHVWFVYANDLTNGILFRLLLFVLFIIFGIGGYFVEKGFTGESRFKDYFAVSAYLTAGASIIATSTIEGLSDPLAVLVCIGVSAIATLWLLTTD